MTAHLRSPVASAADFGVSRRRVGKLWRGGQGPSLRRMVLVKRETGRRIYYLNCRKAEKDPKDCKDCKDKTRTTVFFCPWSPCSPLVLCPFSPTLRSAPAHAGSPAGWDRSGGSGGSCGR